MEYIITVIISLACTVGVLRCLDINIYKTYRGKKELLLKHKLILPIWTYLILIGMSFVPLYINFILVVFYYITFFPILIFDMEGTIIQYLYPSDKFPRKELDSDRDNSYAYHSFLLSQEKSYLTIRKGTPLYVLKRIIVFIFGGLWRVLNKKF